MPTFWDIPELGLGEVTIKFKDHEVSFDANIFEINYYQECIDKTMNYGGYPQKVPTGRRYYEIKMKAKDDLKIIKNDTQEEISYEELKRTITLQKD